MSKVLWDKQHRSEYDDIVGDNYDEFVEEPIQRRPPPQRTQAPQQQQYFEDDYQDSEPAYKLNKSEKNVVQSVTLRLEQARIYEALIKHDVFESFDADANAIATVKAELKEFLLERLETLFSMKSSAKKSNEIMDVSFELPFNEEEISFLKALALKGTGGASASSPTATVTSRPVSQPSKPRQGLKSLSKAPLVEKKMIKQAPRRQPEPEIEDEEIDEPLPQVSRSAPRRRPHGQEEELSDEEAFAEAKRELKKEARNRKALSEMNEDDLAERNARIAKEQKKKKAVNPNAAPMPTQDMINYQITSRQQLREGRDVGMSSIVSKVLASKK